MGQEETQHEMPESARDPLNSANLPATIARNEKITDDGFWAKIRKTAGRIPFSEEACAAWFCAKDPNTPRRVRGTLLAALAYFVIPADLIPDFISGFGFTDDATVLATAISIVSGHVKEVHKARARSALFLDKDEQEGEN